VTSERSDESGAGGTSSGVSLSRPADARDRLRTGVWRVAVAEESMAPALAAGDWLLLDPTPPRWPRRGSVVVFHEPESGLLAIKRVAAGPGDHVRISAGILHLSPDQAWLLGDNGALSIDSRRYGPVGLDALVGRAWFRYAPASRIGLIPRGAERASLRAPDEPRL
jgi:type IV secretory pathway protease TraF